MGAYARPRRRRRSRATWRPYSKYKVDRDIQPWFTVYFFSIAHPCYEQLTPVKSRYPLTSITWPYRGLKCPAHRGHVFFFKLSANQVLFSIRSRAHIRLTCWSKAGFFRKPNNVSPGLNFIRIITFSSIQMFFADLFWVYGDYKTQKQTTESHLALMTVRKSNSKQKTSPQSYKTQINILPFPGLAQSGTEQPGKGATLLGWLKSI